MQLNCLERNVLFYFASRLEVHSINTQSYLHNAGQQTDKTECFTMTLEAESQGYRHFLNRMFCSGVGGRTTGLQTHS